MRVVGLMVVKNEADRYLEESLKWNREKFDDFLVYDDRSVDGSADVARDLGIHVVVRGQDEPSFMDNEGLFRRSAWYSLWDEPVRPEPGVDWIFAIDADEFVVGDDFSFLLGAQCTSFKLRIHECFGADGHDLKIRLDGFWGNIWGVRLGRYIPRPEFTPEVLGGGSLPKVLLHDTEPADDLSILHLGYMRSEDREKKHDRYTSRRGRHAGSHVESIIQKPKLTSWTGPNPLKWTL